MFSLFDGVIFSIVPIMVVTIFIIVIGMIIVSAVSGAKQWKKNNDSPILTVEATVVAKRADIHYHTNNLNNNMHRSSSTTYYVTFEVESGDRMELKMQGAEYGMLVEQDTGKLTFQGTRYLGFKRS